MDESVFFDENNPPLCLDYHETVIAQYANSPRLLALIRSFSEAMKICVFFSDFYENIWDLNTATGKGLDIWGQVVGVNRTVKTLTGFFWGFNEETLLLARPYHDLTGFNDSLSSIEDRRTAWGMFRDYQELEGEITFTDKNFKKLIFAKAHANVSNYNTSDLNFILMYIFGYNENGEKNNHEIYVRDNFDMSITLILNWLPSTDEVAIIMNAGLLFKPAGISLKVDIQSK